jgi:hypothetical protein
MIMSSSKSRSGLRGNSRIKSGAVLGSSGTTHTKILIVLSVLFIIQSASVYRLTSGVRRSKTPSGLYHDDGKGHTVLTQKFSKKDVREISYDILNIMGFNHRPHPHLVDNKSPASQFLMEVYNSIAISSNEADVDLSNGENGKKQNWHGSLQSKNLSWSEFNVDPGEVDAIKKADAIISFVNRGEFPFVHLILEKFRGQSFMLHSWSVVSDNNTEKMKISIRIIIMLSMLSCSEALPVPLESE